MQECCTFLHAFSPLSDCPLRGQNNSMGVELKAPLCKGGSADRRWGIVTLPIYRSTLARAPIPPSRLTPCHPLTRRAPLSLRDISPHCGESPFNKGGFAVGRRGRRPRRPVQSCAAAKRRGRIWNPPLREPKRPPLHKGGFAVGRRGRRPRRPVQSCAAAKRRGRIWNPPLRPLAHWPHAAINKIPPQTRQTRRSPQNGLRRVLCAKGH